MNEENGWKRAERKAPILERAKNISRGERGGKQGRGGAVREKGTQSRQTGIIGMHETWITERTEELE